METREQWEALGGLYTEVHPPPDPKDAVAMEDFGARRSGATPHTMPHCDFGLNKRFE